jgi:hypothetical protein
VTKAGTGRPLRVLVIASVAVLVVAVAVVVVPRVLAAAGVPRFVFSDCASPGAVTVNTMIVEGDSVRVAGWVELTSLDFNYDGFVSRIRNGVMSIGLHRSRKGSIAMSFDETILTHGERVTAVVLTDGVTSRTIYP